MSAEERWLAIPGYEGRYEVSDFGRVRSLDRVGTNSWGRRIHIEGQIIKTSIDRAGYPHCGLSGRNGKRKTWRVHKLVLLAFVGPRPGGTTQIRHLNGDETDNRLSNLDYGTASQNAYDRVRHGTHVNARRTHCRRGHEFTELNTYIEATGGRRCNECRRMQQRGDFEADHTRKRSNRLIYGGTCPTCSAQPGKHCRSLASGRVTDTHVARQGQPTVWEAK